LNIYGSIEKKKNGNEECFNIYNENERRLSIHMNRHDTGEEKYVDIHKDGNIIFMTYFLDDGRGPKNNNPC
jgi:hypothetical protein